LDDFEAQLYKLSSKIKATIPFLQMYDQLYRDTILCSMPNLTECSIWTAVEEKQVCDIEELKLILSSNTLNSVNSQPLFSFDISNPTRCNAQLPVVILYGDPSDPDIKKYFKLLTEKSDAGEICFIFRFKLDSYNRGRFLLSGYGVELAVKVQNIRLLMIVL
jgi:hypothetical protein